MARNHDIITLEGVTLVHQTEGALLVGGDWGDNVWVPKSKCEYDASDRTLQIEEWLAQEKGLI